MTAAQGEVIDPITRGTRTAGGGIPRSTRRAVANETGTASIRVRREAARPHYSLTTPELAGQTCGPALKALDQPRDLLAEGLPPAAQDRADQTSYPDVDHDPAAIDRHIRNRPDVVAVHLPRQHTAHPAGKGNISGPRQDPDHLAVVRHVIDDQRR